MSVSSVSGLLYRDNLQPKDSPLLHSDVDIIQMSQHREFDRIYLNALADGRVMHIDDGALNRRFSVCDVVVCVLIDK